MRITYDPKYEVLYLKLGEAEKVYCKEIDEDITKVSSVDFIFHPANFFS